MKRTLQIAFSLGLSVLFIWLSMRGTPVDEVWGALVKADYRWVLATFAVLLAIHVVRTLRWGLLLQPLAKVDFRTLNPIAAVGFLGLMVLPLRLGELARPLLAAHELKVRRSAALASVVVERVADGVFMGLVLVGLLWTMTTKVAAERLGQLRTGAVFVTLGFGVGLVLLVLAYRHRTRALALLHSLFDRISPRLADRAGSMMDAFFSGLDVVPSGGKVLQFVLVTAGYWGLIAFGLKVLAPAFGFELAFRDAWMVVGLQVIGALIPAGPGGVGAIQFFTVVGLEFVLPPEQKATAIAFAHASWGLGMVQQIGLGLVYVAIGKVQLGPVLRGLWRGGPDASEPASTP